MTALSLLSGLVVSAPVCLSAHALAGLMTAAEVDDGSVQAVTEWSVDVPADGSVQITLAAGESIQLQQATVLFVCRFHTNRSGTPRIPFMSSRHIHAGKKIRNT